MLSYFIIILLTNISDAKPLIVPLGGDAYATTNELKDLKIYILSMLAMGAGHFIYGIFSSDRKEVKERLEKLESIVSKIDSIQLSVARIEDAQLTDGEVRKIAREEVSYIDAVKRQRN